jgi:hypothetical protein
VSDVRGADEGKRLGRDLAALAKVGDDALQQVWPPVDDDMVEDSPNGNGSES